MAVTFRRLVLFLLMIQKINKIQRTEIINRPAILISLLNSSVKSMKTRKLETRPANQRRSAHFPHSLTQPVGSGTFSFINFCSPSSARTIESAMRPPSIVCKVMATTITQEYTTCFYNLCQITDIFVHTLQTHHFFHIHF